MTSVVRPAKIKISLRIRAVRSESLLGAFWIAKGTRDNENSDKTAPWANRSKGSFSHVGLILECIGPSANLLPDARIPSQERL